MASDAAAEGASIAHSEELPLGELNSEAMANR